MARARDVFSLAPTSGPTRAPETPAVLALTRARTLAIRMLRASLTAAIVAVAYAGAARVGEELEFPSAPVSVLWAPNAILLAALLLTRRSRWWLYFAFVLPAHLLVQLPLPEVSPNQVVIQYVLNCSTALIAALLLSGFAPDLRRIDRVRPAIMFVLLAGVLAPLSTSVLMAAAFFALRISPAFWLTVLVRTLTNSFAILTLVPLSLHVAAWLRRLDHSIQLTRVAEASLLASSLASLAILAFIAPHVLTEHALGPMYILFAILLWATVRFGVVGVCSSMLMLGVLGTSGVVNQTGTFTGGAPVQDDALWLLLVLVLTCVTLLLLAAALEERKSLEEARTATEVQQRQTQMLHSAVLASIHDQIVVLDQSGVVIETNRSWRRFVEHSARQPFERAHVGDQYLQTCAMGAEAGDPVAAELLACLRDVLAGGSMRRLEFSRDTPDGLLWYEMSVEQLHRPEGGAVVTRTNITATKQVLNQAREQRQQLAHLGRAAVLGELSGAFAHELVQPLTSILGNAEAALTILSREQAGPPEIRDMLRDIVKDDVRAAEVIQRLRSMLARGEIQRQPIDLNQIVRDVVALARSDIISRNVSVITQLDPDIPLVLADGVQLQQVVLNLIVNACEAMSGAPADDRRLTIGTTPIEGGRGIECFVADRGRGIPADQLERIFQPFVTTKKHGLGLGLAICRSIIEAHGGRLWAESAEGGGSVFRFTADGAV
jgi:two-component system, LuxR family, sensor kinase FixL